jgi:CRP-like cAMP-binding protein
VLSERIRPAEISPTDRAGTALVNHSASAKHTNNLLGSLPHAQFGLLSPYMVVDQLEQGTILVEAGDETENVYFPHVGMLSLLAVLKDGRAIETATVGREGVVGAMAGLGAHISHVRVVVQLQAEVTRIPASRFRKATGESTTLRNLCVGYNEILLSQARINVACNAVHIIEARFCRWLLQTADTAGCNTINLTQQFLAEMLGVRRTSVTEVAKKVQRTGAIHYTRGEINILDRRILERLSCECYATLVEQSKSLRR